MGTSTFILPWNFLQLPPTASMREFEKKSKKICKMSYREIIEYNAGLPGNGYGGNKQDKHDELLPYYCFLSSYIIVLMEGMRF